MSWQYFFLVALTFMVLGNLPPGRSTPPTPKDCPPSYPYPLKNLLGAIFQRAIFQSLFSSNNWIFVQCVLWMDSCMSYFHLHMFLCLNDFMFVPYDKFFAMWLVSEFLQFWKVESVSTFFCHICWVIDIIA